MAGQVQGNKSDVRELRILERINIKWLAGCSGGGKQLSGKDHRSKRGLKVRKGEGTRSADEAKEIL